MIELNKVHNLTMNCTSEKELKEYLTALNIRIDTKLCGDCTILPPYYFKASTSSNMKQDKLGKFYKA